MLLKVMIIQIGSLSQSLSSLPPGSGYSFGHWAGHTQARHTVQSQSVRLRVSGHVGYPQGEQSAVGGG